MANTKQASWGGDPPARCEHCRGKIEGAFVDGKTTSGPWAIMCHSCFEKIGVGLGTGRGQMYVLDTAGGQPEWLKREG